MRKRRYRAIDRIVAERIRAERLMRGMTQTDLASAIGVTYQQVHKYETQVNRVTPGIMAEIAQALGVPVSAFFDEADPALGRPDRPRSTLNFHNLFCRLSPRQQDAVLALMRALADEGAVQATAAE